MSGPSGKNEIIRFGNVIIDLGGNRRIVPIDENGEANIKEIPEFFRNSKIGITTDCEGYLSEFEEKNGLEPVIYLPLKKK